jgi:hypothetical protein
MVGATFELRRFRWATPERLEIDGRFVGLGDGRVGDPVLVLSGDERTHRLLAVDGADDAMHHGEWHAEFAWQETPAAFDVAHLELADGFLVELPPPRLEGAEESDPAVLDVRHHVGPDDLDTQFELLAAESQLAETGERLARSEDDLARARDDLAAERAARAEDAERFRAALAGMRATADRAVREARADADAMRSRLEELESAGEEAALLRDRLTSIRDIADSGISGDRPDAGGEATSP